MVIRRPRLHNSGVSNLDFRQFLYSPTKESTFSQERQPLHNPKYPTYQWQLGETRKFTPTPEKQFKTVQGRFLQTFGQKSVSPCLSDRKYLDRADPLLGGDTNPTIKRRKLSDVNFEPAFFAKKPPQQTNYYTSRETTPNNEANKHLDKRYYMRLLNQTQQVAPYVQQIYKEELQQPYSKSISPSRFAHRPPHQNTFANLHPEQGSGMFIDNQQRWLAKNQQPINIGVGDKLLRSQLQDMKITQLRKIRGNVLQRIEDRAVDEVIKQEQKRVAYGLYKSNYLSRLDSY